MYNHPTNSIRLMASWNESFGMNSRRKHNCSKIASIKNTLIFGML